MTKRTKAKKMLKKEKKKTSVKTEKTFVAYIRLPIDVKKEDIKFYTIGKKLVVARRNWKHIKEIVLPFSPDKKIEMRVRLDKLILKIRERQ